MTPRKCVYVCVGIFPDVGLEIPRKFSCYLAIYIGSEPQGLTLFFWQVVRCYLLHIMYVEADVGVS